MATAILDTTVVADVLLRRDERADAAESFVRRFDRRLLPVYALKELKGGPLRAYAWLHDQLCEAGSVEGALDRLARLSRTPRRNLTATAIEALAEAEREKSLVEESGSRRFERLRLALWRRVVGAWRNRRRLATDVIAPLDCYHEVDGVGGPNSSLDLGRFGCERGRPCAMAALLLDHRASLERVREALELEPAGRERDARLAAVTHLLERGATALTESQCLSLGDAVFAVLCPEGGVIVTTNVRDHAPLARSLNKQVERPR